MGGLKKDKNRHSCRPSTNSDRVRGQVTQGRAGVGSRTASWGGGRTGACMQAEGEMGQRLSPSLLEAGLPPPPPRRAEAHDATRDPSPHVPSPASNCGSVASERLPTEGRARVGPGDGSTRQLGWGPCPVLAPPCSLPHSPDGDLGLDSSLQTQPQGPAVPGNRRAVGQGLFSIKRQQSRQRRRLQGDLS